MPDQYSEQVPGEVPPTKPQFAPGELEAFDFSPNEFVELSTEAKNAVQALCSNASRRDTAARRMEVEQSWEARLYKRGYHYLLPRRGGGWELPQFSKNPQARQFAGQMLETNIYGAHCDILTSALNRDIPQCRFEPFDPNYAPDITAAEKAEEFKEIFARNNDLRGVHTSAADYMCTDGRVLFYTRMVIDGQKFGYEDPEDNNPLAPEDETTGAPQSPNIETGQEQAQESNQSPTQTGRKPRGREVVSVFGKLEHKCPIPVQEQSEMDFVQLFLDPHISRAKARFPWIADKIKPGGMGVSEIELDRIARINSALAIEGSNVTSDTFSQMVTVTYTWLRPCSFMHIEGDAKDKDAIQAELFQKFPDGMLAVYAGSELAFARNEGMDDHLHVLQAFPGSGQNRIALMSKVLPIQKRLNNLMDLQNDYFVRTVPQKWFDSNVFNIEAISSQTNVPGGINGFQGQTGRPTSELIFIEPTPTAQPELPEFIERFFTEFPEMLSGALPSLFGAESNTDTVGGIAMQRDQALGRLSSPWGALQLATSVYFRQAVQCAAACREKLGQTAISESVPGKGTVTVEVSDLKGNVLCFPKVDSNFPETWIQKSSRYQQFMTEAAANPVALKLASYPPNLKLLKDAIGLTDFEIPEADAVDKQLGEFEILLKTGPVPNPAIQQAQEQLLQNAQEAQQLGHEQQFEQMMPQVLEAVKALPPMVSTVPVAQDGSEDHSTEREECKHWMNSAEGRKYKNGSPEEKASFENVHLHFLEHDEMANKLAPPQPTKPPSESMSAQVDKMPPEIAAQMLGKFYGIDAKPQQFSQQDATETEQKILEKKAAPPKPPMQPGAGGKPNGSANSGAK